MQVRRSDRRRRPSGKADDTETQDGSESDGDGASQAAATHQPEKSKGKAACYIQEPERGKAG